MKDNNKKTESVVYIGFWKRLLAFLIDFLILFVLINLISFIKNDIDDRFYILLILLYNVLFDSSKFMGTPGKIFLNIVVVDENFNRLSLFSSILRFLMKTFSILFYGLGILLILFTKKKIGFHDFLIKTYVIYNKKILLLNNFSKRFYKKKLSKFQVFLLGKFNLLLELFILLYLILLIDSFIGFNNIFLNLIEWIYGTYLFFPTKDTIDFIVLILNIPILYIIFIDLFLCIFLFIKKMKFYNKKINNIFYKKMMLFIVKLLYLILCFIHIIPVYFMIFGLFFLSSQKFKIIHRFLFQKFIVYKKYLFNEHNRIIIFILLILYFYFGSLLNCIKLPLDKINITINSYNYSMINIEKKLLYKLKNNEIYIFDKYSSFNSFLKIYNNELFYSLFIKDLNKNNYTSFTNENYKNCNNLELKNTYNKKEALKTDSNNKIEFIQKEWFPLLLNNLGLYINGKRKYLNTEKYTSEIKLGNNKNISYTRFFIEKMETSLVYLKKVPKNYKKSIVKNIFSISKIYKEINSFIFDKTSDFIGFSAIDLNPIDINKKYKLGINFSESKENYNQTTDVVYFEKENCFVCLAERDRKIYLVKFWTDEMKKEDL